MNSRHDDGQPVMIHVERYLATTTHLTAAQSGALIQLLMFHWHHGGLPDDDRALARIARMTWSQWKRHRPVLQEFFTAGWGKPKVEYLREAKR
jgi:uncharacterized protein YdaU (DUF1376 family)